MKLAMRVGSHYRLKEIQPRHFEELAKDCGFSTDAMLAMLKDLATSLPQSAVTLLQDIQTSRMSHKVLAELVRGLTAQCNVTARAIGP